MPSAPSSSATSTITPPTGLLAGLAAYLASNNIAYALTPNGKELVVGFEEEGTPNYFSFVATPGWLHLFLALSGSLAVSETDEGVGQLLSGLSVRYPLPPEWQSLALYEINDRRELGLYLRLPMPRRFGPEMFEDALVLCERLLDQVAADSSAT